MVVSTYTIAYIIEKFTGDILDELGGASSLASLLIIILLFGFLFVFVISHDILNREINSRTARFLVTKTSRDAVVYGKFLGLYLFWLICILISSVLIMTITKAFDVIDFVHIMIFMTYPITLCSLLSVIFCRPGHTMLIGLLLSISMPILSLWSMGSSNMIINWIKYFTPYYYAYEGGYKQIITLIMCTIFLLLSVIIFRKRDL